MKFGQTSLEISGSRLLANNMWQYRAKLRIKQERTGVMLENKFASALMERLLIVGSVREKKRTGCGSRSHDKSSFSVDSSYF